jgi:hypothetical protein
MVAWLGWFLASGAWAKDDDDHALMVHALFVGAAHDYRAVPLALTDGAAAGAAGVVTPFQGSPFDQVTSGGGELGLVHERRGVRVGVAHRWLYPSFSLADGVAEHGVVGVDREVSVRGVGLRSWRFLLGAEAPWTIAPSLDLVGEYHGLRVPVAIDGEQVRYDGDAFGFSAQAGLRVPLDDDARVNLMLSGTYGLWGHPVASGAAGLVWRW